MPITINGSGTVTGISAGGLPDAIITQPELAANVAGTGPAFSYYQSSAVSLSSGVFTKITFTTSEFDTTSGMYASSRFTPTIAGYYQINSAVQILSTNTTVIASVYKNGSEFKRGTNTVTTGNSTVSAIVYLNGSTDYVEIYGYQGAATQNSNPSQPLTYFQAFLARAA